MLDEAAFYTRSGNIPAIFLIHFGHSYYIRSTCTFEVNSRHSSCILLEFLDARTVFGSHPVSTLTAFVQHSRHFPTSVRAAIELQSYGVQSAFWTLWQHSKYSYCVRTTFEMHSRANTLGMCRNHSMRVRSEFIVRYSNGILKKSLFNDIYARMWLEFWKSFIPTGSASFRLSVTGAEARHAPRSSADDDR